VFLRKKLTTPTKSREAISKRLLKKVYSAAFLTTLKSSPGPAAPVYKKLNVSTRKPLLWMPFPWRRQYQQKACKGINSKHS